jgi:hypothetical protein
LWAEVPLFADEFMRNLLQVCIDTISGNLAAFENRRMQQEELFTVRIDVTKSSCILVAFKKSSICKSISHFEYHIPVSD